VPVREPSFWSLYCTVKAPHEAGTHVGLIHADVTWPTSAVHVAVPEPEYPSSHFTKRLCAVEPDTLPNWALFATVKAPQDAGTHVTKLHVDVGAPESGVHVALAADPLYPLSHVTATTCVVNPLRPPAFWSLNGTVNAPQDAATHVTVVHADVIALASAVHVAVPEPLYPASQLTTMLCVVVPVRDPSFWSLYCTVNAPHEAGTHVTVLHADVVKSELAVHVAVPDP
jgi:hypothetical protein